MLFDAPGPKDLKTCNNNKRWQGEIAYESSKADSPASILIWSTTDSRRTLWISGAGKAGNAWNCASVYILKHCPGPVLPARPFLCSALACKEKLEAWNPLLFVHMFAVPAKRARCDCKHARKYMLPCIFYLTESPDSSKGKAVEGTVLSIYASPCQPEARQRGLHTM